MNSLTDKISKRIIGLLLTSLALLPLLLLNGCRKAEQRREPFIPDKHDGVNIFSMASLKNDHLLSGSFKPPLLGSDGVFSRKLTAPGGRVKFFLPVQEDVVVQLAVAAAHGLRLRLAGRSLTLATNELLEIFPAEFCRAGDNYLEFQLPAGEIQLRKLAIYPRRFMRLPHFRQLLGDQRNIFLPARLRYALKPLTGEALWLKLSWQKGKKLDFTVELQGEKNHQRQKLRIESGKEFKLPLLPEEYQRIELSSPGDRQGVLRLETSELRRPLPELDRAELRARARGKNVVLLLLDAARPDRLQTLGNRRAVAPNIDRFAAEAITFANAKCEATYTVASTGTLLTGLPAEFHGVTYSFNRSLGRNFITLAEMFKNKGYYTASATANNNYSSAFQYDRGYERFDELFKANPWPPAPDFLPLFADYVSEAKRQGKPFFVYMHLLEPHMPYTMPEPYIGKFQNAYRRQSGEFQKRIWDTYNGLNKDPQAIALLRDCYDESYNYADAAVGRILAHLQNSGLTGKTIVIILSDHGEGFAEHGLIGHNVVWFDEGIKILQVWRFPGFKARIERKPSLTSDLPVTLGDVFALPNAFRTYSSGENIFALPAERRCLTRCLQNRKGYPGFAVEQYPYKLALYYPYDQEKIELYDLARDPGEKINIFHADCLPGQALWHYLRNHLQQASLLPRRTAKQSLSVQDIKNLEALGYINE